LQCAAATTHSTPYPTTLVLLVSNVNISPISSSDTPTLALGDAKRLSRGRDPFVLILQHQITESISHNQIKYLLQDCDSGLFTVNLTT
jgi:hypothetical protein